MLNIEQHISPLVENMFPAFYKEDGPNFIAFVKAYYEWLENSSQNLTLNKLTGFDVGDTVSQTLDSGITVTGIITSVDSQSKTIIVTPSNTERFRCITICGVNHPINSSSGSQALIDMSTPGGVTYQSRNLFNYRDIDTTIDRFILNFKEKYLKNIQFDTATNKKLLVKNSLDMYRSKGTERSIDLFFKLIYGVDAEVYYPGDDIFKLSDGEWTRPTYLEVTATDRSIDYVGKQIIGELSGSTAFVERFIKRRVKDAVVNILYLSNIVGEFNNNEPIGIQGQFLASDAPRVIGSLTSVQIITGGKSFAVGDIVQFFSIKGDSALARVSSTTNTTGVVDFDLIYGGWGYTTNANVYVSEKVLDLSNVITSNTEYFQTFEYVYQPQANIVFDTATGDWANGDSIFSYHANNDLRGQGAVITVNQTTGNTQGEMYITIVSGQFPQGTLIYSQSNAHSSNVATYTDDTASGFVIGVGTTANIEVTSATGVIAANVEVYQSNATSEWANAQVVQSTLIGSTYILNVQDLDGAFRYGTPLNIRESDITANVSKVDISIGLHNIVNTFSNTQGLYTYGNNIGTTATVSVIGGGFGASFDVGTLSHQETVLLNTDLLSANNGLPPATDAYTDSYRRTMSVASSTGFTNNDIVYQDFNIIAFNPSSAINNVTGFITLPAVANTRYSVGSTVKYVANTGNTVVNDLKSGDSYYVYSSNTTGIILARRYDNLVINSTNFPTFANNIISETGHYLTGVAYGTVTNNSVGSLTTSGVYNDFAVTGGSITTSSYSNGNIVLYSNTNTNTFISSISTAASVNVSNQAYTSLPLMSYAYGFPNNIQGNIEDVIFSCLTIDQFTLGSIASITGINPGADYTVDPFVLVYQPYIPSFERKDYIVEIEDATGEYRVGELIQQTPVELTYYILSVNSTSVFSLGEALYQGTSSSPSSTMIVTDIYTGTSMRVNTVVGTISNTTVTSYATGSTATISNNSSQAVLSTSKAIVKEGSNTSIIKLQRIQFNNTFEVGETLTGVSSGVTSTIGDIYQDNSVRQIGVNAQVIANVVTANGTVTSLEVTDSGFGYSNSEVLTYRSQDDGLTAGIAKSIVRGVGTGSGYYKSSKGFLSDDKKVHDSDYYQEYSYEVLSKLPFEKYSEMFKKVMHTAGTKVFGSVVLSETGNTAIDSTDDASEIQFQFNSNSALTSSNNNINVTIERQLIDINSISDVNSDSDAITVTQNAYSLPNLFSNGDMVKYVTNNSTITGLSNNTVYFVVDTTTSTIKLASQSGGASINIAQTAGYETHYLQRYDTLFANGDIVRYYTADGNTAIQTNIYDSFTTNTGFSQNFFINVNANKHQVGDKVAVSYTHAPKVANVSSSNSLVSNSYIELSTSNPFSNDELVIYYTGPGNTVFQGLQNNAPYYVIQANSSHVRLATQQSNTNSVVDIVGRYNNETGHFLFRGMTGITSGQSYYIVQSNTSGIILSKKQERNYTVQFNSRDNVSNTNNTVALTDANTYFANGDHVRYYTGKTVTPVIGLANNQYYYVRYANTTTVQLSSQATGTVVDITSSDASQTGHYLVNDYVAPFRSSNTGVFVSMTQTQLTNNAIYYCVNTVPTYVQLARTANGTPINITANGISSGTSTNGHFITTHV